MGRPVELTEQQTCPRCARQFATPLVLKQHGGKRHIHRCTAAGCGKAFLKCKQLQHHLLSHVNTPSVPDSKTPRPKSVTAKESASLAKLHRYSACGRSCATLEGLVRHCSAVKHDFTYANANSTIGISSLDKHWRDLLKLAVNALSQSQNDRSPFDDITSQNPSASLSQTATLHKRWPPVPPEEYGSTMSGLVSLLSAELKSRYAKSTLGDNDTYLLDPALSDPSVLSPSNNIPHFGRAFYHHHDATWSNHHLEAACVQLVQESV
jgi:hypothetical protein